jgi:hypothetical protein
VLVGALWTLVAAELFLRAFAPVPMLPRYVVATSFGIRGNQPNQVYVHRTPDYTVEIRTNAQGMRADEDIDYAKPAGVRRILVLGDSFAMGYGVDLDDTFLAQMQRRLEPEVGPLQIVNLAVSGHGNAEELIMLREEGLRYDPDLVLLAWHRTDLADNVRSALFSLDGDRLVRKNATFLPQVELRERLFRFAAYRWLAGSSHLYNFLRERAAGVAKSALAGVRALSETAPPARPAGTHGAAGEGGQRPYAARLTIALLAEIQREVRAAGAELVVLDIPNTRGRTRFDSSFPDLAGTPLDGTLRVVSPLDAFAAHRGELIYWEHSHFHFTPLGCKLVGSVLADYVRDHGLLAPAKAAER